MSLTLPPLRVGEPVCYEALSIFPLFAEASRGVEYRLAPDALADQSVVVEEVSEGGSVPDLLVDNQSDVRVLFLEGEELVGAKQNRILNMSVLIAAHSKVKIPVSCVEQGRWRYQSRFFGSSGSHSPSKLRRALKASVSRSVRDEQGHRSDQAQVWREVAGLHAAHGVESGTGAMSDAFETHQDRIAQYRERVKYVAGACGVAVAIGGRIVAVDVFDKPATCEQVWPRLLSGVVFDALEAAADEPHPIVADVEQLLSVAADFPWQPSPTVGEGEEFRAESPCGDHASALVCNAVVVHHSVLAAV